jgi:hypothetical protein
MLPAYCSKCRRALPEGAICCAEVRYMWRCRKCFKLSTGFAIPYGRCSLCDGELQIFADLDAADSGRQAAIRAAVQAVLDAFLFYKLARDQSRHWDQRAVMERLCAAAMGMLHELEKQYHPHLEPRVLEPSLEEQDRLAQRLFRGMCLSDHSAVRDLYGAAIDMERRTGTHLRLLAAQVPGGPEKELFAALASKDESHITLLEEEVGMLSQAAV